MERMSDHLYGVGAESLSFAPSFTGRAFLLRRRDGNILLYSSGRIEQDADALLAQGGIVRHYLNHRHQAMPSCDWVSERFAAPLFVPQLEEAEIAKTCRVGGTFASREFHFPDLEVIPIPGHTEGSTAFLWDDGHHRHLFTGDTIYLKDGAWTVAVLADSDRAAYARSLELIGELEFDVLVPSMARGQATQTVTAAERGNRLAELIERVRAGAEA